MQNEIIEDSTNFISRNEAGHGNAKPLLYDSLITGPRHASISFVARNIRAAHRQKSKPVSARARAVYILEQRACVFSACMTW